VVSAVGVYAGKGSKLARHDGNGLAMHGFGAWPAAPLERW